MLKMVVTDNNVATSNFCNYSFSPKVADKADYSSIRAYNDIDVEQIPLEYRADPRLVTEMDFKAKGANETNATGWERDGTKHFESLLDRDLEYWNEANAARIENRAVKILVL